MCILHVFILIITIINMGIQYWTLVMNPSFHQFLKLKWSLTNTNLDISGYVQQISKSKLDKKEIFKITEEMLKEKLQLPTLNTPAWLHLMTLQTPRSFIMTFLRQHSNHYKSYIILCQRVYNAWFLAKFPY